MEGSLVTMLRSKWHPLLLLVLLGAFCLLGTHFLLTAFVAEYLAAYFGYFAIAAVVLVSITACLRAVPWRTLGAGWNLWRGLFLGGLVVVTFLSLRLEPQTFKIVMDEPILASVSASMHRDRLALYPGRGHDLEGAYEYLDGKVDKRPLLFPFLVSVLHDLTGYRVSNVFLLNTLLAPLFWFLVFLVSRRLGRGRDEAGALGVLMVFAVPLVTHLATSGGFDFLSATLLMLSLHWLQRLFEEPTNDRFLVALTGSLALLGNTRYEGPYWVLPFGLAVLFLWIARREIRLPRMLVCAPLLILPALVHRQVYSKIETMWQAGIFDREETFSFSYLGDNLSAAGAFFFSLSRDMTNNYLVSVLGLAALITLVASILRRTLVRGEDPLRPAERAGAFFLLGLVGLFWVIMAFNWGYFANYITMRLSLPFVVGMGVLIPWAAFAAPRLFSAFSIIVALAVGGLHFQLFDDVQLWEHGIYLLVATLAGVGFWLYLLRRNEWTPRWLFPYIAIAIAGSTFPKLNVHSYLEKYAPRDSVIALLDFSKRHEGERYLLVSPLPLVLALEMVPTIDPPTLVMNRQLLKRRLEIERGYEAIYYYAVYVFDYETDQWNAEKGYEVTKYFELEPVETTRIGYSREGRFYRVTPREDVPPPDNTEEVSAEESTTEAEVSSVDDEGEGEGP